MIRHAANTDTVFSCIIYNRGALSRSHWTQSYVLSKDSRQGHQQRSINKVAKQTTSPTLLLELSLQQSDLGNWFLEQPDDVSQRGFANYISHKRLRAGFTCGSPCSQSVSDKCGAWMTLNPGSVVRMAAQNKGTVRSVLQHMTCNVSMTPGLFSTADCRFCVRTELLLLTALLRGAASPE